MGTFSQWGECPNTWSATGNAALRNASTIEAARKAYARSCQIPKVMNASMGSIVRLHLSPYAQPNATGFYNVELPAGKHKLHGPLAAHPRLVRVDPDFCDDTLDGETFFCSAHHCQWASGAKNKPFVITHLASGLSVVRNLATLAEASDVAARLANDPSIDWALIDADPESDVAARLANDPSIDWALIDADPESDAAKAQGRVIAARLREWGYLR